MSEEIKILSATDEVDSCFGESIIQYQKGNAVSFFFSDYEYTEVLDKPKLFIDELARRRRNVDELPLWSDLSKDTLYLVTYNPFDMHFEEGVDEWPEERAEVCWNELDEVIDFGTDAPVTVYADAMGHVNWAGHPVYGEPYFDVRPKEECRVINGSKMICPMCDGERVKIGYYDDGHSFEITGYVQCLDCGLEVKTLHNFNRINEYEIEAAKLKAWAQWNGLCNKAKGVKNR